MKSRLEDEIIRDQIFEFSKHDCYRLGKVLNNLKTEYFYEITTELEFTTETTWEEIIERYKKIDEELLTKKAYLESNQGIKLHCERVDSEKSLRGIMFIARFSKIIQ